MSGRGIGIAVAAALALAGSATGASAAISLDLLPTKPTSGFDAVRAADLNRDGRPDIVGSGFGAWVYLNLAGGLSPGIGYGSAGGGSRPAIADLNGDGLVDVAIADPDGTSVLFGDGAGRLSAGPVLETPRATSVAAGDVNADGQADLVVGDRRGIDVLLGTGAGGFQPAPGGGAAIAGGARQVALADLNRDGRIDLLLIRPDGGASLAEARLGDGAGGFGAAHGIPSGPGPVDIAIGDMNADTIPDVVTANLFQPVVAAVALGDGRGDFAARAPVAIPGPQGGAGTVALGDLDRDGDLDVAYALREAGDGDLAIFLNDGSGALSPAGFCPIRNGSPGLIDTADFDRDGRADVVVPMGPSGSVLAVFRSIPIAPEEGFDVCGSALEPPFAPPITRRAVVPRPARISAARLVHARRDRALVLRVTANRALDLRGTLWRHRRRLATASIRIRRGPNRVGLGPRLGRGVYRLVLTARALDGAVAPRRVVSVVVR